MRRFVLAVIVCSAVSACGSGLSPDEDNNHGSYEIDPATGETTATMTTEDGTLSINAGAGVAEDLPSGWSLYPGASVLMTTNASMADGKNTMVVFESEGSVDDVIAFYREQAESNGVKIEMEMTTGDGQMIAGSIEGGGGISVVTNVEGDNTVTNLMIGDDFGG